MYVLQMTLHFTLLCEGGVADGTHELLTSMMQFVVVQTGNAQESLPAQPALERLLHSVDLRNMLAQQDSGHDDAAVWARVVACTCRAAVEHALAGQCMVPG